MSTARELNAREVELVKAGRKTPKPILTLPDGAFPISEDVENFLILLPSNVKEGWSKTISRMLSSRTKLAALDLRLMSELRETQNLYLSQKGDWYQREVFDVNELITYIQVGHSLGGGEINGILPEMAAVPFQLLKYSLDEAQYGFEVADYETRANDFAVDRKSLYDLTDSDAQILQAWLKVISVYGGGASAPTQLNSPTMPTQIEGARKLDSPVGASPYKYNVAQNIEKAKVRDIIIQVANSRSYPAGRLLAQIWHESSYIPTARNPTSTAAGLGQFLKNTGYTFGMNPWPEDFFIPEKNANAVVTYMTSLMKQAKKWGAKDDLTEWQTALASYAEGPGYIIKDLIANGYCQGSGTCFKGVIKPFTWAELEPILTGQFVAMVKDYVRTCTKLAQSPP
jgi:soluble lytic murein transglycosylase-like protein